MNSESWVSLAGGLGMFLLGIHHLTEGLKGFAGDALRRALERLVSGKWSGVLSGAVFTALIQSSSAAILTVIGFVSAGLVTHTQAVAVVLGANLGTTATSWLVAVFGFKVKISAAALPMIGLGAFLWLLAKGRVRAVGAVLAGFGLIFTGIELLQTGMAGVEWNLEGIGRGPGGVWILAGIGAVMTIVMQSSSAAGATTLVAVASGSLTLDQAFAMVVGQNLGTTATAALASIGAGMAVKRTALAHILFNVVTGILALLALGWFSAAARSVGAWLGDGDGVLTLAAFHTIFNLAGVVLFFPWMGAFAKAIERITGRGGISAVERLDPTLAKAGGVVAMEAAWRALVELSRQAFGELRVRLDGGVPDAGDWPEQVPRVAEFIERLRFEGTDPATSSERRLRLWHALDHFRKLSEDLREENAWPEGGRTALAVPQAAEALGAWVDWAGKEPFEDPAAIIAGLQTCSEALAQERRNRRSELLERVAGGRIRPDEAMAGLTSLRQVDGAFYHAWRLADSLRMAVGRPGEAHSDR